MSAQGLHAFVLELGRALSLAGTAVSETQQRLVRVAAANGAPDARIAVLPTVLLIALGAARRATLEPIPQRTGALRLDQIAELDRLVKAAEAGRVGPAEGLDRIRAIRVMRPRYGPAATVAGHALMTVGLCLILQPAARDVALAAVFGGFVGTVLTLSRRRHPLPVLAPILCAAVVATLAFTATRLGLADPGLRPLIASLVTFLPGSALTTGTVEVASGEMVAGASRLVFGGIQLLLLAAGIVAGAALAGLPAAQVAEDVPADLLGGWAPWLGVLLFGLAVGVYFSAPRGAVRWLLLVLLIAWMGQRAGGWLVDPVASGFFGALLMTPVALAVSRLPGGPPSQVTFLPAFWLLVPGAVGLIGVTEVVGDPASAAAADLVRPAVSIVAIALGVLCGVSAYARISTALRGRTARRG